MQALLILLGLIVLSSSFGSAITNQIWQPRTPYTALGSGSCRGTTGQSVYVSGGYSWVGATSSTSQCQANCDADTSCTGYQQSGTQVGVGGTGNCIKFNQPLGGVSNANNDWAQSICYAKPSGNCVTNGIDTYSTVGADGQVANRAHATYVDCENYDTTFTFKLDVQDILGIYDCPLIQDWIIVVDCPHGICEIDQEFNVSLDVCDALAFVMTAGMANLAVQMGGATIARTAIGQGIRSLTNAQVRTYAGFAQSVTQKVVSYQIAAMCDAIGTFIQHLIECLGGGESEPLQAISYGIGELLSVIQDIFGNIQFKLDVKSKYTVSTGRFSDWNSGLEITWNMGLIGIGPRMILTGVARLVEDVRDGDTCDNFDTAANAASVRLRFVPEFTARFRITCAQITVVGMTLEQLGNGLREAGEHMVSWMTNMGTAVGETVSDLGENIVRAFTGRPSSSHLSSLRQTYRVSHRNCKQSCPSGWNHFATSDHGCCSSLDSCGGNRKWCRIKKTYTSWSGRREMETEFEQTNVENELSFLKSLASISEKQAEEMLATFPEEEVAEVEARRAKKEEEALADEGEWVETHPPLTEEEIEAKIEDLVKAVEPMFAGHGFEIELAKDADTAEIEELLARLLEKQN